MVEATYHCVPLLKFKKSKTWSTTVFHDKYATYDASGVTLLNRQQKADAIWQVNHRTSNEHWKACGLSTKWLRADLRPLIAVDKNDIIQQKLKQSGPIISMSQWRLLYGFAPKSPRTKPKLTSVMELNTPRCGRISWRAVAATQAEVVAQLQ